MPYPIAPVITQQRGDIAGPSTKPTVFSRLGGQSSSSSVNQERAAAPRNYTSQEKGKSPMQQMYIPKRLATPMKPISVVTPVPTITIGSMEAPIITNNGPIVIGGKLRQAIKMRLCKMLLKLKTRGRCQGTPSTLNPSGAHRGWIRLKSTSCSEPEQGN